MAAYKMPHALGRALGFLLDRSSCVSFLLPPRQVLLCLFPPSSSTGPLVWPHNGAHRLPPRTCGRKGVLALAPAPPFSSTGPRDMWRELSFLPPHNPHTDLEVRGTSRRTIASLLARPHAQGLPWRREASSAPVAVSRRKARLVSNRLVPGGGVCSGALACALGRWGPGALGRADPGTHSVLGRAFLGPGALRPWGPRACGCCDWGRIQRRPNESNGRVRMLPERWRAGALGDRK